MIRFIQNPRILPNLCQKVNIRRNSCPSIFKNQWCRTYSSSFPGYVNGLSSSKTKPSVLITRPDLPKAAIRRLEEVCDVDMYEEEQPMPRKELLKRIRRKDGVLCVLTDRLDEEAIQQAGDDLKVISTIASGYDHIDMEECKAKGVAVGYTPGLPCASVAEWTVTMMLCAGRNFVRAVEAVKSGEWRHAWDPVWLCGRGLSNSVVGIVGMGGVGQMVCQRVMAFGVEKVLYYDIFNPVLGADQLGAELTDLSSLLRESDFVVCAVNLWEGSAGLFDARAFHSMKASAVFVNTSRGEVVDQEALFVALRDRKIRAAGLDVTVPAPLPADHPLLTLPNIIITPHVATAETHVRHQMAELAADNLLRGLKGQPLKTPVPTRTPSKE